MLSLIAFVGGLIVKLWSWFQQKPPIAEQDAKALGAATAAEQGLEAENAQLRADLAAGAAADAERLRADPETAVHTDPGAAVNNLPGERFRD